MSTKRGSPYNTRRYKLARAAFLAAAPAVCAYERCPIPGRAIDMRLSGKHKWGPTVDHRIPTSKGGDMWDIANWRVTHRFCNGSKGDRVEAPTRTELTW